MTFLAYLFIIATITFYGAMIASGGSKNDNQKYYGTMLLAVLVMTVSALGLAFGVLGLLPEVTWR